MLYKHSMIYMLAKAIPAVIAFVALSLYTHLLSPDDYGLYVLINSAAVFGNAVIFNWLPAGTLRFWPDKQYSVNTFVSTLAVVYLRIIAFLFIPLFLLIVYFWDTPNALVILSTFVMLLTLALYTSTQNLLTTQIFPVTYAQLVIWGAILMLGFGGILAYFAYSPSTIIFGSALGLFLPSLFAYKKTWVHFKNHRYDKALYKRLLNYGIPLASASILEEFTQFSDRFMLAGLQDKAQSGMYTVGYGLSGYSVFMIMTAINLAAYPVIIKLLENKGKAEAMRYFKTYAILLIGVSLPAVAGLILVGPNLVHLVIGEEYQDAVIMLLPWITIALFFGGIQAFYLDLAFQLGHFTKDILKISIVVAIINLVLNYKLIPVLGMNGAAIATLSSYFIGMILSGYMGARRFTIPFPIRDFGKIILAVSFMVFLLWWLKDSRGWFLLIAQLGLGLLGYLVAIILLDLLDIRMKIMAYVGKP